MDTREPEDEVIPESPDCMVGAPRLDLVKREPGQRRQLRREEIVLI